MVRYVWLLTFLLSCWGGQRITCAEPASTHAVEVIWKGDLPRPEKLPDIFGFNLLHDGTRNPFFPRLSEQKRGVPNVLIQARGAKLTAPEKETITLEASEEKLGWEGRSAPVYAVAIQSELVLRSNSSNKNLLIQLRGDAFQTVVLTAETPRQSLVLKKAGRVDICFAHGPCWPALRLFVCDSPYALTDANGKARLTTAGSIEKIEATMIHWRMSRYDRDPELQSIPRIYYEEPLVQTQPFQGKPTTFEMTDRKK